MAKLTFYESGAHVTRAHNALAVLLSYGTEDTGRGAAHAIRAVPDGSHAKPAYTSARSSCRPKTTTGSPIPSTNQAARAVGSPRVLRFLEDHL